MWNVRGGICELSAVKWSNPLIMFLLHLEEWKLSTISIICDACLKLSENKCILELVSSQLSSLHMFL